MPSHPDSPAAELDDAQRSAASLRAACGRVDDFSLRQQRVGLDKLVQHARVLERAIVDHLAHAGITEPIDVAAALLGHRDDPYPLERDLLEFQPAAR